LDETIFAKIDKNMEHLSLKEVLDKIKELKVEHPDMEIFLDGDRFAIVGRKK